MYTASECCLTEEQGFRKDRTNVQEILTFRLTAEKYLKTGRCVYNCFVKYTKAIDSNWHNGLWAMQHSLGVPDQTDHLSASALTSARLIP